MIKKTRHVTTTKHAGSRWLQEPTYHSFATARASMPYEAAKIGVSFENALMIP